MTEEYKPHNYRVDDNSLMFDTSIMGGTLTTKVPLDQMKLALEKLGYKVEKKEPRFYGVER